MAEVYMDGRFIGTHPYKPSHELTAGVSYRHPEDTFGAGLDLTMPIADADNFTPELQLSAFYRLTESVRLSLVVVDPLSLLMKEGRKFWGPYEAPGFHVYLGTNISL